MLYGVIALSLFVMGAGLALATYFSDWAAPPRAVGKKAALSTP